MPFGSLQAYLEHLPEWSDELRARSMFASFSQPREVNPEAWDARFNFWRSILADTVRLGLLGTSIFAIEHVEDLAFLFCRNQITPLGLGDVLAELRRREILVPASAITAEASYSLAEMLIWRPLRNTWGWVTGANTASPEEPLVFPHLLHECAEALVRKVAENPSPMAAIQTVDSLQDLLRSTRESVVTEDDVRLLILYMKSRKMLAVLGADPAIVRIRLPSDKKGPLAITEEHKNVAQLQQAVKIINKSIAELDKRLLTLRSTISAHLRQKDRQSALSALKRSKQIETVKAQRLACLDAIETLLIKIEGAKSDAEIFNSYKLGEATLKRALAALPSISTVDDVMVSIQHMIADQEAISEAIAQPMAEEDEDLLAELAIYQLPEVPSPISTPQSRLASPSSDGLDSLEQHMQALDIGSPKQAILM